MKKGHWFFGFVLSTVVEVILARIGMLTRVQLKLVDTNWGLYIFLLPVLFFLLFRLCCEMKSKGSYLVYGLVTINYAIFIRLWYIMQIEFVFRDFSPLIRLMKHELRAFLRWGQGRWFKLYFNGFLVAVLVEVVVILGSQYVIRKKKG